MLTYLAKELDALPAGYIGKAELDPIGYIIRVELRFGDLRVMRKIRRDHNVTAHDVVTDLKELIDKERSKNVVRRQEHSPTLHSGRRGRLLRGLDDEKLHQ